MSRLCVRGKPLPSQAAGVLRAVEEAAAAGMPCPTNGELADAVNGNSSSYGSAALQLLADRGMIAIDRSRPVRVVTILATGASTAIVEGRPKTSGRSGPSGLDVRVDGYRGPPPEGRRVDSHPCPRCGARDRHCGHTASRLVNTMTPGAQAWA